MLIKAFNREEESLAQIRQAAVELADASEKTDWIINAINPGIRVINRFGQVAVAVLGGVMLLKGHLTPGRFQAFFQYANQAGEPITELSYMINSSSLPLHRWNGSMSCWTKKKSYRILSIRPVFPPKGSCGLLSYPFRLHSGAHPHV